MPSKIKEEKDGEKKMDTKERKKNIDRKIDRERKGAKERETERLMKVYLDSNRQPQPSREDLEWYP